MADNDAVAAVVDFLSDLADGRVWGSTLPDTETEHMPRAAIVVRAAGGPGTFGGGYLPVVDDRVDIRCYGPDAWTAKQLANDAGARLHRARDESTPYGRIMWAAASGRPSELTETDTGWPLTLISFQVLGDWWD